LFTAEYVRVTAIANRIVADPDVAEDVAQEVFLSFYHRHPPSAPYASAWLHRAAVHAALNTLRGRRRRAAREAAQTEEFSRLHPEAAAALDPQRALEAGEQRREVLAALARLPTRSAAVLALRHSGLSYAEVASALGVSASGVGTLLRRAEEALRKEMSRAPS
jgi:RNA polymerase sigma-70 factor (ECF subfamily)